MRRPVLLALAAAGAAFMTLGGPALAHDSHPVTANPTNGLTNGATVSVSAPAGAFPAGMGLFVLQCSNDPDIPLDLTGANACSLNGPTAGYYTATAADDGSVAPVAVTIRTGQIGQDARSVCPPTNPAVPQCGVIVTDITTSHSGMATLMFATPPTSTTTSTTAGSTSATPTTTVSGSTTSPTVLAAAPAALASTGPNAAIARWLVLGLVTLSVGCLICAVGRAYRTSA